MNILIHNVWSACRIGHSHRPMKARSENITALQLVIKANWPRAMQLSRGIENQPSRTTSQYECTKCTRIDGMMTIQYTYSMIQVPSADVSLCEVPRRHSRLLLYHYLEGSLIIISDKVCFKMWLATIIHNQKHHHQNGCKKRQFF